MTVTKSLPAWLRTWIRDRGLPPPDPTFLDAAGATLYVVSPSDGTVAPLAVTQMEQLVPRQRTKVSQWKEYPRGMFLDELPNTPSPKVLQYCFARKSTSATGRLSPSQREQRSKPPPRVTQNCPTGRTADARYPLSWLSLQ